ncbi:hypothetical protein [Streptomyces sp. DASNCL29]|uniref:MmyB family transcriptional regulator n=1 Tax=Streptomyces sp. DASNCL29 TaxID=2583819 RepID=UPI0019D1CE46|nr:hypothetical protein [Streptomyces sp. DASNCL29]
MHVLGEVSPGLVVNHRRDVLSANPLACALLTDFDALPYRERNLARFVLLDPAARELYGNWEEVAETLALPADRDQEICLYTAEPGAPPPPRPCACWPAGAPPHSRKGSPMTPTPNDTAEPGSHLRLLRPEWPGAGARPGDVIRPRRPRPPSAAGPPAGT